MLSGPWGTPECGPCVLARAQESRFRHPLGPQGRIQSKGLQKSESPSMEEQIFRDLKKRVPPNKRTLREEGTNQSSVQVLCWVSYSHPSKVHSYHQVYMGTKYWAGFSQQVPFKGLEGGWYKNKAALVRWRNALEIWSLQGPPSTASVSGILYA